MRIGANYGYLQPCLREAFSISQLPHCQRERVIMNKWGHSKTYVPQKRCNARAAWQRTSGNVQSLADDIHKPSVHHLVAVGTRFWAIINEAQRVLHAPVGLWEFKGNDEKTR